MIAIILSFFASLVNKALQLDAETCTRINKLNGKSLAIDIIGLNQRLIMSFQAHRIELSTSLASVPAAVIKGSPLSLLQLLSAPQAQTLLVNKSIIIEGEIELLQAVQQILRQIDIDWEEYLSRFIGDVPAHFVGNTARDVHDWGKTCSKHMQQNLIEYLQEELQYVPAREQVTDFMTEVDQLRDAAERLQVRYQRLQIWANDKDKA